MATQAEIERLYQETLGRPVDPEGLAFYLQSGKSPADIKADLAYSPEGQQVIKDTYQQVLGRPADEGGLMTYTQLLATEKGAANDLYGGSELDYLKKELAVSPEGLAKEGADPNLIKVAEIYQKYLNRSLDASGVKFFEEQMKTPEGIQAIEDYVKASGEASLKQQLGRNPTEAETDKYLQQLEEQRKASGGFGGFLKSVAPIVGVGLMLTGAGSALGAGLLGAGASATAAGAVGGGLIGGGLAAATGGNVLKGAALGGLGGYAQAGGFSGLSDTLKTAFADITGVPVADLSKSFAAQDALTMAQNGMGTSAIQQNLIASGMDSITAASLADAAVMPGATAASLSSVVGTAPTYTNVAGMLSGGDAFATTQSVYNNLLSQGMTPTQATQTINSAAGGLGLGTVGLDAAGNLTQATAGSAGSLLSGAGAAGATTVADTLKNLISPSTLGGVLSGVVGTQQAQADKADRDAQAAAIERAAANAAAMQQFQPIGMTTRFGSTTTPTYDAQGRLTGFGYTPAADIAAQRDRLLSLSNQALPTTTNVQQATQDYYNQLQALQRPADEQTLAGVQARLQATGRAGLGLGATTGAGGSTALAATNPELAAYYNALAQRQASQSLTAQDVAQQRLNQQIATSGNLFTQAQGLETAAQQPLTMGTNLGTLATTGSTNAANTLYGAALNAAQARLQGNLDLNTAQAAGLLGSTNAAGGLLSAGLNTGLKYLTNLV